MIEFSAIPASDLKDAGITEKDMKLAIDFLRPESKAKYPFGAQNLMFYVDRFGDFMSKKTKVAQLCQLLFKTLEKRSQMEVLNYIMDSSEDEDDE